MSPSNNSIYDILAQSITVKDVAQPIVLRVPPDALFKDVCDSWEGFDDIPCIVSDAKKTYGVIWFDDDVFWEKPVLESAADFANPILAENIISDSFPLIDLPNLFIDKNHYFVLTGTQITHLVSFEDFNSLPMKACLFTLFLEMEANFLRILRQQTRTDLEGAFSRLSSKRLYQITNLYNEKQKTKEKKPSSYLVTNFDGKLFGDKLLDIDDFDYSSLLGCTNFSDKKTMFQHFPELISQLPFVSRTEYDKFFFNVQDMRNKIAHSDPIIEYPYNTLKFSQFIAKLRQVVEIISSIEDEVIF